MCGLRTRHLADSGPQIILDSRTESGSSVERKIGARGLAPILFLVNILFSDKELSKARLISSFYSQKATTEPLRAVILLCGPPP